MEKIIVQIFFWIFIACVAFFTSFLIFYRFYFLRKPERDVPKGNVIVSPANGKVGKIIRINNHKAVDIDKGLIGKIRLLVSDTIKEGYIILIVMTPFNVHYQRSPVDAVVKQVSYTKGKFLNAMKDASHLHTLENEHNEFLLYNEKIGKIKVVQVAGFLARRIHSFATAKQKVLKGEEIGLICLGSQVLLVLPKLSLDVKEGDMVIDGETIIARY